MGYGLQLREKQKAKRIYFALEGQFRANYEKATAPPGRHRRAASAAAGDPSGQRRLPSRLRAFAPQARQVVRHGHVQVNGRKVNIPSFQVKVGDEIAIREGSKKLVLLETAKDFASGQTAVQWLQIDR